MKVRKSPMSFVALCVGSFVLWSVGTAHFVWSCAVLVSYVTQ